MSKAVKSVAKVFTGGRSGSSPGVLGQGKFTGSKQSIDQTPFKKKLANTGEQKEVGETQARQRQRLEEKAEGKRPSLAEANLKKATDRSLKQQVAAAQARRGSSAPTERSIARASEEARRQERQDIAAETLKEQQLAETQLAGASQVERAAEMTLAEQDRAREIELQKLLVQENLGVQGLNLSGFQSAAQQRSGLVSNIGSGLASMFSDKNRKKKIKSYSDEDSKNKIKKEDNIIESETASKLKDAKFASARYRQKEAAKKFKSKEDVIAYNKKQADKSKEIRSEGKSPEKSKGEKFISAFIASKQSQSKPTYDSTGKDTASRAMAEISDEDSKENIKDFSPKSFLDALGAHSYEYKESHKDSEIGGKGRYLSPMAQEIEKAGPVGKSMVKDTSMGKIVDYGKGFGAMLASMADMNKRIKRIEDK